MKHLTRAALCLCVFVLTAHSRAQVLRPLGPEGGDVLSLGQDPAHPQRVYLGTADGHVFASEDGGEHWELRGRAGERLDSVVTAIVVDPRGGGTLYAAAWTRDGVLQRGGVYRSADGGRTWTPAGLAGEAVRALALSDSVSGAAGASGTSGESQAEPTLVAGTLDGVYRSRDGGKAWEPISPVGDPELSNLDSLALDPANPDVIYAGTFHLPWKTTDGGLHWTSIHTGMIDDSDVMSLLADRAHPGRVYASACSGIYRSDTGGEQWQKVQGIPYTARRTLEILEDPARPETVFAATTEGLWKSSDAGSTWQRITPADWSVTAMVLGAGAPDRVLIGVEQRGVLASDDGGADFHDANRGFFHRQILAAAREQSPSGGFLLAMANAPEFLAVSSDSQPGWRALGQGPTEETLGRIYASPDGWWAALSAGGLERYDESKSAWVRAGRVPIPEEDAVETRGALRGDAHRTEAGASALPIASTDAVVSDMAFSATRWYAATPTGLLGSSDHGANWSFVHVGALTRLPVECVRVSRDGEDLWIASLISLAHSADGGRTWKWIDFPPSFGVIRRLETSGFVRTGDSGAARVTLLVRTYKGLFVSRDAGETWNVPGHGLPEAPVEDVATEGPYFLAAMQFGGLYLSRDAGRNWEPLAGTVAEGFFPAVLGGGSEEATSAGQTTAAPRAVFYAGSATEGLYAIEIGPEAESAPAGDTGR